MENAPASRPSFAEALRFWGKLGLISFGGPSGQIAIMHAEVVERRRWVDESRFLHALNYCMLLPGPEATQLAVYLGWLLHGTVGGLAAGVLFVLPATVLLWALSWLYVAHGSLPWLAAIFAGLKPAVVAIVVAAVWRIGRKALRTPGRWALAAAAFVAIYFFHAPFPLIVGLAAALGWFAFATPSVMTTEPALSLTTKKPSPWPRLARTASLGLALWLTPTLLAGWGFGWRSTLARQSLFFDGAALVTFGGAYAVLPFVAQQAVESYGWLSGPQMLDGLGLAETTPGPLIIVLEFVGFLGAWQHPPAGWPPLLAGTLGAALTVWATFAPSFIFVFLGAPFIESLRGRPRLDGALNAITAAVVGVIGNLAVWFALNVWFPTQTGSAAHGSPDVWAILVSIAAFAALTSARWSVVTVILLCAALGWLRYAAGAL